MPKTSSAPPPASTPVVNSGLSAAVALAVTGDDTASAMRSGDVPVLATPRVIALCEEASCLAIAGRLQPGQTSVASRIQFDHLAPVAIGATVVAEATLDRVEGRRLVFTVTANLRSDAYPGLVGAGRITRVVVDREKFLAKASCSSAG